MGHDHDQGEFLFERKDFENNYISIFLLSISELYFIYQKPRMNDVFTACTKVIKKIIAPIMPDLYEDRNCKY